eukprot:tig00020710_g13384.t1
MADKAGPPIAIVPAEDELSDVQRLAEEEIAKIIGSGGGPSGMAGPSKTPDVQVAGFPLEEVDSVDDRRAANGGLIYANAAEIVEQRKIGWDFLKSLPSNLLHGGQISSVSLPVRFFEPRSFLDRMAEFWLYTPLLTKAAQSTKDPIERLKYVVAFSVAGFHKEIGTNRKPFNPILGETFQATMSDGTTLFCEQTSHHPPVSHFQLLGPGGSWELHGHLNMNASMRGNTIKVEHQGYHEVVFPDTGQKVIYTMPDLYLRGLLFGQRVAELFGETQYTDPDNRLGCLLQFNPSTGGFLKSISSWFSSAPAQPTDTVRAEIFRFETEDGEDRSESADASRRSEAAGDGEGETGATPSLVWDKNTPKETIVVGEGSWLTLLAFDGTKYWEMKAESQRPAKVVPVPHPLPSDCRFREDLVALSTGDWDLAQRKKHELEEKQRLERKWRASGKPAGKH